MNAPVDRRWWRADDEEVHKPLVSLVQAILDKEGAARRTWLQAMRCVYLDEPLDADASRQFEELNYPTDDIRTPWPALRCGVDAMHSKIAKTHPRCLVLTEDGDWDLQNRAELLTQWLDGEFDRLGIAEIGERVWHDCLLYGTGAIYVGVKHDMPHAERVKVADLFVDPLEAENDCVRSLYRARRMDVGVLSEMFPTRKDEIRRAKTTPGNRDGLTAEGETADMVLAIEAWRLPDGPNAKGRHVIAIDGVTLLDDREWADEQFPIAFVHWSRDPEGFWGIGLVEQMLAPQGELDEIALTNSESRHVFVPSLHAEMGPEGNITTEQLDNGRGRFYRRPMGTQPPTLLSPGAIFLDMAQLEEIYIQRVWNLAGISQLSVASQKPGGLNSGTAIQNFTDVESERFAVPGRSWERLHIDVGKLLVACAEKIAASDASKAKKLKAMGGKDTLQTVSFADARMGDNPHKIRVFPVSQLSNAVAAKIDEIEKMVNAGMIADMDDARELADIPDLKRYHSITSAGRRLVRKLIDNALKYGIAKSPTPYMPLPYFIRFGSLSADLAEEHDAPEANVQTLRDMVQAAIEMKAGIDAEAAAKVAASAPQPPAGPPMPPLDGPPMGPQPMPPLAIVPPPGA